MPSAGLRSAGRRFLLLASVLAAYVAAGAVRPSLAEWTGPKGPQSGWYEAQKLTDDTRARLNVAWGSCCDHSDVVKTRFRVNRDSAADEWWYLDGNTWRLVPADTIHWNEPTPTGEPVMFAYQGQITCFYPGDTGG